MAQNAGAGTTDRAKVRDGVTSKWMPSERRTIRNNQIRTAAEN